MLDKSVTPSGTNCLDCGAAFTGRKRWYCAKCSLIREREVNRLREERKARTRGIRAIGALIKCVKCQKEFVLTAGPQKRCEKCRSTYLADWHRNRRRSDPLFNMTDRLRRAINNSLGKGLKNRRSWERLVGWTQSDLMRHLERQFLPGMTWDNRGQWHIDHIVPLAKFSFDSAEHPDFKAAWALTNLRPLWARDNQRKHARRLLLC